jgi:hypothetical protein
VDHFAYDGLQCFTDIGNLFRANIMDGNVDVYGMAMNDIQDRMCCGYLFLNGKLRQLVSVSPST